MTITDVLTMVPTIDNPLNGILPNFSIFGVEFTSLWQKLVAGIWAVGIILAIVFIVVGVTQMAGASSSGLDLRGARVGVLISGGNIDLSRFAQLVAG